MIRTIQRILDESYLKIEPKFCGNTNERNIFPLFNFDPVFNGFYIQFNNDNGDSPIRVLNNVGS